VSWVSIGGSMRPGRDSKWSRRWCRLSSRRCGERWWCNRKKKRRRARRRRCLRKCRRRSLRRLCKRSTRVCLKMLKATWRCTARLLRRGRRQAAIYTWTSCRIWPTVSAVKLKRRVKYRRLTTQHWAVSFGVSQKPNLSARYSCQICRTIYANKSTPKHLTVCSSLHVSKLNSRFPK
jgi:hypothetical protein